MREKKPRKKREETVAEWGERVAPGIARAIDERIRRHEAHPDVAAACHRTAGFRRLWYAARYRLKRLLP